jgi:hypothetical protein
MTSTRQLPRAAIVFACWGCSKMKNEKKFVLEVRTYVQVFFLDDWSLEVIHGGW